MLNVHVGLVLIAPLLLTLSNASSANSNVASSNVASSSTTTALTNLKCRNATQVKPLHFVDGRLASADSVAKIVAAESAVEFLSVTCMSFADSTRLSSASLLPGIPVISIWTQSGPMAQMKAALIAIRDAQQAQFAKTGSYRTDYAALPAFPAEIKVTFESTAAGWNAITSVDRMFSPRCRMSVGSTSVGEPQPATRKPAASGEMVCEELL